MIFIEKLINYEYSSQLKLLENFISKSNNHILLHFYDKFIMNNISLLKNIPQINSLPKKLQKMKYVVNLDFVKNQSLLYVLLEQSEILSDFQIIIITTKSNFLNKMEKRVRSRFNRNVIIFPFVSFETFRFLYFVGYCKNFDIKSFENKIEINNNKELFVNFSKNDIPEINNKKINKIEKYIKSLYLINPSINQLLNRIIRMKYDIPEYKLYDTLKILTPIHIVILILIKNKKIKITNILSEYKKITCRTLELRKFDYESVYKAYMDIKEFDLENVDWLLLCRFIEENSPLYLKNLIKNF